MPDITHVPWPGDENPEGPWTADELMRWLAADGLFASARSWRLLPSPPPDGVPTDAYTKDFHRYMENVARLQGAHDLYLVLDALRALDPAKADEVANRCVLAAVAGDSYGEWLYEWAEVQGLAASVICELARASVEEAATGA